MPATATFAASRSGAVDRRRSGRGHGPLLQKAGTPGTAWIEAVQSQAGWAKRSVPTLNIDQGARITRRVPAVGAQANRARVARVPGPRGHAALCPPYARL